MTQLYGEAVNFSSLTGRGHIKAHICIAHLVIHAFVKEACMPRAVLRERHH